MSVYHQMGHHSNNLVDLPEMSAFAGAIFSPINAGKDEVKEQIGLAKSRARFENILDPQLYVPATERGRLKEWPYYPKDVDTADLTASEWWAGLNENLTRTCQDLGLDSLCSPTVIPKVFDDKYYARAIQTGSELVAHHRNTKTNILQTALINLPELTDINRPLELASIISGTKADRVYLIFVGAIEPRRELNQADELLGAMRLIHALETNGVPVLVGFCSSDVLLWKVAGASSCAAGKFFNLRRFTRQRFEEPTATGGGQLPYWFEEALVAFLRQGDLIRIRKTGLLSEASSRNPFCQQILQILDEANRAHTPPRAWLAISWRQFLYWFADIELRLTKGEASVENLLRAADSNWSRLDEAKILPEERFNTGTWIRIWLNTLYEFLGAQ